MFKDSGAIVLEPGPAGRQASTNGLMYGAPSEAPTGKYRSELCDCCICPAVCLSWFLPFIVWGQLAKQLYGGSDQEKGMKFYYAIVLGFSFMFFVSACLAEEGVYVDWFIILASLIVVITLQKRVRKIYDIKPRTCCKSEACDDCCRAVFCMSCVTFQMGNHLFDYKSNPEITCDPTPTHFIV